MFLCTENQSTLVQSQRQIVGVNLQDGTAELLCSTDDVLTAPAELVHQAFPDVLDLETLTEDGPKDGIVEQKGQDVVTNTKDDQLATF